VPRAASRPLPRRSCRTLDPMDQAQGSFISLHEVLSARAKARSIHATALVGFCRKALPVIALGIVGMLLVIYFVRPTTPPRMFYFYGVVLIVGFAVLPVSLFALSMAKQYFWYDRELRVLESRIRAGEVVPRPSSTEPPASDRSE
jgi:hypothetical protein